jgi:hypothetical protein
MLCFAAVLDPGDVSSDERMQAGDPEASAR